MSFGSLAFQTFSTLRERCSSCVRPKYFLPLSLSPREAPPGVYSSLVQAGARTPVLTASAEAQGLSAGSRYHLGGDRSSGKQPLGQRCHSENANRRSVNRHYHSPCRTPSNFLM